MAQLKIAEYTFDNSVGDCLPSISPNVAKTVEDVVDGNITTRKVFVDDTTKITGMSFTGNMALLTVEYLHITSDMTSAYTMFYGCQNMTSVNFSNADTSNITTMYRMFCKCPKLTSLDLSSFDTSKVTNMYQFVYLNSGMTSLTFGDKFDTSKVTDMGYMFANCSGLTSLDVSKFDTSAVTNMSYMFSDCKNLTSLDVSNFDTGKVTNMSQMFRGCSSLTTLNLSNWNTSTVSNMDNMFNGCSSLTSLDLSSFNTEKITSTSEMFRSCSSLTSLDLSSFNTEKVTNLSYMFTNCSSLTSLDLSSFNTEKVTNMGATFFGCKTLAVLDLSNWNTISATSTSNMFNGSTKLTDIGLLYSSEATINKIAGILPNNPKNIFYYDADPSQLTPVEGVTFKKYRTPTTIQLPPHIQLHSLPDGTKDEVDLETGILTRNVGRVDNSTWTRQIGEYENCYVYYNSAPNKVSGNESRYVLSDFPVYPVNWTFPKEGIYVYGGVIYIALEKDKHPNASTIDDFKNMWIPQNNPIILYKYYNYSTTEQLILNYNNSCDYGRILPTGICDKYDVVNSTYTQTMTSILLNGVNIWDNIEDLGTVLKFTATGTTVGVDNLNMKGAGGLYCDNDLFPNINDDSDVEHCRVDEEGNKFYIYVDKERLMSPDLIGWQIWLQTNPFNMWYELEEHLIYTKPYEELDPTQARWDTMDCVRGGSIKYNTHTEDGLTIYPTLEYVAPSINNFEVPMLEPNTEYTMYAEGIGEGDTINLGGNDIEFADGTVYTSGENQWLRIDDNDSFYNVVITKGDTTGEVVPYFEGMQSVKMPVLTTTNQDNILGKCSITVRGAYGGYIKKLTDTTGEFKLTNSSQDISVGFNGVNTIIGRDKWCCVVVRFGEDMSNVNFNVGRGWTLLKDNRTLVFKGLTYGGGDIGGFGLKESSGLVLNQLYTFEVIAITPISSTWTFDDYELYKTNILTVNEPVELRGIGEVKDELNLITGELTQRIGEIVLDGSENWATGFWSNQVKTIGFEIRIKNDVNSSVFVKAISDKILYDSSNNFQNEGEYFDMVGAGNGETWIRIRILRSKLSTEDVEGFKKWLSQNNVKISYELSDKPVKTVDLKCVNQAGETIDNLCAFDKGTIKLSSETGFLPTMTYSVPSTNVFNLPSIKTGTRYTLKYPSASGSISIGDMTYKVTSPSMLFTTPLTMSGDASALVFTDTNPQDVMLVEGDYSKREMSFFKHLRSSENIAITTTYGDSTNTIGTGLTLRSLPNGLSDKLNFATGKLVRVADIRDYQEGDNTNKDVYTDGYKTVYPLANSIETTVEVAKPVGYSDGVVELKSDALIPTFRYRLPSSNNFVLDLLKPSTNYTMYANYELDGNFTLGGTMGTIGNAKVVSTSDSLTDTNLTFSGNLGLSNVMLVEGDSTQVTTPKFNGLLSVENATVQLTGSPTEINRLTIPDTVKLRSIGSIIDELDLVTGVFTKRIERVKLIGSENWQLGSHQSTNYQSFKIDCADLKQVSLLDNMTCDRFKPLAWTTLTDKTFEFITGNGTIEINIHKNNLSTPDVDGFKRWLRDNPTTVHYELSRPVTKTLDLAWTTKPVTSYYGTTTVQSTSTDTQTLKPYFQIVVPITSLEEIVDALKEKNARLEEDNLATMIAVTEVFEVMLLFMPVNMAVSNQQGGGSYMVEVYVTLILKGKKTLEQVPAVIRPQVEQMLKDLDAL